MVKLSLVLDHKIIDCGNMDRFDSELKRVLQTEIGRFGSGRVGLG